MHDDFLQICTANLAEDARGALVAEFKTIFPGANDSHVICLSQEPPAWIELSASIPVWKMLLAPFAVAYLGELGKRAAGASIPAIRNSWSFLASGTGSELRRLYAAIEDTPAQDRRRLGIHFKLRGPRTSFGLTLRPTVRTTSCGRRAPWGRRLMEVEGRCEC